VLLSSVRKTVLLLVLVSGQLVKAQHQTATFDEPHVGGTIPYTIDIRKVSFAPAELPNIHSVVSGKWNDHWVFLGGRTNGLHGMTGRNAFDPLFENREVWVVDPVGKRSWHKSLETSAASGLSQDEVDSLSSVNAQFYQDGETLLVVGGYGYKRSVGDHRTYDTLTAIDLEGLVQWVKETPGNEAGLARDEIKQIHAPYFQVTGGSLEKIGDEFQLVFGQNYEGRYRPFFNGVYTRQVRYFKLTLGPDGVPVVATASRFSTAPDDAFRRRDLNVLPFLERVGLNEFEEKVVVLSLRDDQVPFTNQCSLVVRDASGRYQQYWLPTRFPMIRDDGLELRFGANAEFYPSPEVPQLAHKVLDLAAITDEVVLGHIFGGIVADAGNNGNTGASGWVFEVVLNPQDPAPVLTLKGNTLSWVPETSGSSFLVEESTDLRSWQEKASGLSGPLLPLGPQIDSKKFFRVITSMATTP